jgi:hypothetical protein
LGSNGGFAAEYFVAPLGLETGGGFFDPVDRLLDVLTSSLLGEDVNTPFFWFCAALALRGVLPGDL